MDTERDQIDKAAERMRLTYFQVVGNMEPDTPWDRLSPKRREKWLAMANAAYDVYDGEFHG